jgi:hypothetical protein
MSQVTVTDVKDVTEMKTIEIKKWIGLHKKALLTEDMKEYWTTIHQDLEVLEKEYSTRNIPIIEQLQPLLFSLNELNGHLKEILNELKEVNKTKKGEEKDGTSET